MCRHIVQVFHQRTDQRQSDHLIRTPVGDGPGIVSAGGMTDDQQFPITNHTVDQSEQEVEDIVGAIDRVRRRRTSHTRQIRINTSIIRYVAKDRLDGAHHLLMIYARTVQHQDLCTVAMFDVMHRYVPYLALHNDNLTLWRCYRRHRCRTVRSTRMRFAIPAVKSSSKSGDSFDDIVILCLMILEYHDRGGCVGSERDCNDLNANRATLRGKSG